jgi:hypothetical protein
MEHAVKRFARNILLLHLLLLLTVLGVVLLASRAIREGAREEAQKQAETRQRMVATQTARGIEAFYQSILSDVNLTPRDEDNKAEQARYGRWLSEMFKDIPLPGIGGSGQPPKSPSPPTRAAGTQPAQRPFPRPVALSNRDATGSRDAAAYPGGPQREARDGRDFRNRPPGGGGGGRPADPRPPARPPAR